MSSSEEQNVEAETVDLMERLQRSFGLVSPPSSVPSPPEPECCQTCGGDGYTESFNADHSDVVITPCTDCGPGPGNFDG